MIDGIRKFPIYTQRVNYEQISLEGMLSCTTKRFIPQTIKFITIADKFSTKLSLLAINYDEGFLKELYFCLFLTSNVSYFNHRILGDVSKKS